MSILPPLICPVCWHAQQIAQPLPASNSGQEILVCPRCWSRFPVIDGLQIIVPQVNEYLQTHLQEITQRDDLSPDIENLLAESSGVQSTFEYQRLYLSHYAWDHYGEFATEAAVTSGCVALTKRLLEMADFEPNAPLLDLGCATGRTTFYLAERFSQPTFGVDINFALLRFAARVLQQEQVRFTRRRQGLIYDPFDCPVHLPGRELVQFLAADGQTLPFATNTFAAIVCLNLLDCVPNPRTLLAEIRRVLKPNGQLLLGSPYDWSAQTPLPNWLGGVPTTGDSELVVRNLLTTESGLELRQEDPHVTWRLRLHERSTIEYQVHLITATKTVRE